MNEVWSSLTTSLSSRALAPYLEATNGSLATAAKLYEFDRNLSGSLWVTLAQTKNVVTNCAAIALQCHSYSQSRDSHWLLDETGILGRDLVTGNGQHARPYSLISNFVSQCLSSETNDWDDVLQLLPDHFWVSVMSHDSYKFWPDLKSAFNTSTDQEFEDLCLKFREVVQFMQVIQSGKPIFCEDFDGIFYQAIRLASYVDESFAIWLYQSSTIHNALKLDPRFSN